MQANQLESSIKQAMSGVADMLNIATQSLKDKQANLKTDAEKEAFAKAFHQSNIFEKLNDLTTDFKQWQ